MRPGTPPDARVVQRSRQVVQYAGVASRGAAVLWRDGRSGSLGRNPGKVHVDFELNLTTETVSRAGLAEPVCVGPETSVRTVLQTLQQHRTGSLLVCSAEKLVGIFTERDALRLLAQGADLDVPVETVMARDPVVLRASDTVATAIKKMSGGGYRRLPVVDAEGRPLGIVKVSTIVRFLVEHFPRTIYNLPPDPHPVMQQPEGA
jgi:CBS domain-containing protein